MYKNKTVILSLSWRDIKSPKRGGAELHTFEMLRNSDQNKYKFIQFGPRYKGLPEEETIDGIKYIRRGNVISTIFHAALYYNKNNDKIDFVLEQCNTHRFFTRFWVPANKRIFYIHQLTREIWDINFPFPLSKIGKILETPMLWLQRNDPTITVSNSTRNDLISVGFNKDNIYIIPSAINPDILGLRLDDDFSDKKHNFVYVGRYSKYKGIDASVLALEIVKEKYPDAKLTVVGKKDEKIVKEVIEPCAKRAEFHYGDEDINDIVLKGFVSEGEKHDIMRKSRALLFPSIREGWGLIVSEAGAVGTPSIVYDSPGCRDVVDYGRAGYLCRDNTPKELARLMIRSIEDGDEYKDKRRNAYEFAQNCSWELNKNLFDEMVTSIREKQELARR